jgi:hypothetical protein
MASQSRSLVFYFYINKTRAALCGSFKNKIHKVATYQRQ